MPLGWLAASVALGAALSAVSCGSDSEDSPSVPPLFPADYVASFTEVRDCRSSTEHEFNRIRVLADLAALEPYQTRQGEFPVGAVVLKEEYDFSDTDCTGDVIRYTVMSRLPEGSSPETLDWQWQDVEPSRRVKTENDSLCIGCHTTCGVPPDGFEGTCTVVGSTGGASP